MERKAMLEEDLRKNLHDFKSIVQHPKLLIADHFTSIRDDIDLTIEEALMAVKEDTKEKRLNSIRENMIQKLAEHERQHLKNAERLQEQDSWSRGSETVERIGREIDEAFSSDDYEDVYLKLALEILEETSKIQELLLGNHRFMFFHSEQNPGILIQLDNIPLSLFEEACFRAYFELYGHSIQKSFELFYQVMKQMFNKTLLVEYRPPFVVNEKMPRFAVLSTFIRTLLKFDTNEHVFDFDPAKLDFEFTKPLGPAHQELEKAINEEINPPLYYRYQTQRNPLCYATHTSRMDISFSNATRLNIQPAFAALVSRLNLDNNQLEQFDERFFRAIKSVASLDLMDTFKEGVDFNLNFLQGLSSLTHLSATLPAASFNFEVLRNKRLLGLKLHTATTRDENVPRLRPCLNSLHVIGSWQSLVQLQLRGFDLDQSRGDHLTGLFGELSPRLKTLDLRGNIVRCIPEDAFSQLTALKELDLSHCRLDTLHPNAFASLPRLTCIDLSNNRLTCIQTGVFQKLPELIKLSLRKNAIAEIQPDSFKDLACLQDLDLSACKLKSIDGRLLNGLYGLINLDLSSNQIDTIYIDQPKQPPIKVNKPHLTDQELQLVQDNLFTSSSGLETLRLDGNQFAEFNTICFFNLKHLKHFELSNNQLTTLTHQCPVRCANLVTVINLSGNRLEHLDMGMFRASKDLLRVNLANNALELTITAETFAKNSCLGELELAGNRSIRIHDEAWPKLANLELLQLESDDPNLWVYLSNLTKLKELAIHKSSQLTIERHLASEAPFLRQLTSVDFSSCSIASLDDISFSATFPQVTRIVLAGNRLKVIEPKHFAKLTHLTHLDLSSNLIEAAAFAERLLLHELNLSSNKLGRLEPGFFDHLAQLECLDLSSNSLATVDKDLLRNSSLLRKINLSGNRIKELNFARLFRNTPHLAEIRLADNLLDDIDETAIGRLKTLDLSGNRLTDLGFIRNLPHLETLSVSHNRIESIYDATSGRSLFGTLVRLKRLKIADNPLVGEIKQNDFDNLSARLEHLDVTWDQLSELAKNPEKRRRIDMAEP